MLARLRGLATLSPADVMRETQAGRLVTIDVNARERWLTARVPGARHLDPTGFVAGDLPEDRSGALAFYCSGPLCRKAPNAARRAKGLGYTNVFVMSAGISGWLSAGLPTESGEVGPPSRP